MSNNEKKADQPEPVMETEASGDIAKGGIDECGELQILCNQLQPYKRTALLRFVKQWMEDE